MRTVQLKSSRVTGLCMGIAFATSAAGCGAPEDTDFSDLVADLANEGLVEETDPQPLVLTDPIFFGDANYLGRAVMLGVGNYTQAQLVASGIANNSVSSIRVQPGFKVEAFANGDFTGTSIIVSGDTPSLAVRAFDNQMSSMRISKITVRATFYEKCGKQGYNVSLPLGNYTITNLKTWGVGDNQISEIAPRASTEVEIFQGTFFGGQSRFARGSVCLANVGGGFDNTTGSLKIRSSAIRFQDNFSTGSLENWSAETGEWFVENGTMVGIGNGDDAATYAVPDRSFDGSLVLEADVNMIGGNARFLINSTGERRENEYHLQIWPQDGPSYPNRWQMIRYENGEISFPTENFPDALDGNVPSLIPIPTKCRFTIRRIGGKFDFFVNGIRIGSVTDPNPLPATGKVGVAVVFDYTGAFDNFVVRN
jgi:hypothetical protein